MQMLIILRKVKYSKKSPDIKLYRNNILKYQNNLSGKKCEDKHIYIHINSEGKYFRNYIFRAK